MTPKKVILIGNPVAHSLSPGLHSLWLKELGIAGSFEAREAKPADIPLLVKDLRDGRLVGLNATIPFKAMLFELADECDKSAAALGAANSLYIRDGKLMAVNTDPEGFIENLNFQAPDWNPAGKTALILGTGAAARAAALALLDFGVRDILISGRNPEKIAAFKAWFPGTIESLPWGTLPIKANLVVNATPLGLPGKGPVPLKLEKLFGKALVYDLVYGRDKTEFLMRAEHLGHQPIDGLGMLAFQGIPAFEAWFGQRPRFHPSLLDALRKNR